MTFSCSYTTYTDNKRELVAINGEIETYSYPPLTQSEILHAIKDFIFEKSIQDKKVNFTLYPKTPREFDYFREGVNWIWNPENQSLIAREPSLF